MDIQNEKESYETQIKLLELRIEELKEEIKMYQYKDSRKYDFDMGKPPYQNFGIERNAAIELEENIKFLFYKYQGNIIKVIAFIENAPLPLREKCFMITVAMMFGNPPTPKNDPVKDVPDFIRFLMKGR